jgi:hypothetical protein
MHVTVVPRAHGRDVDIKNTASVVNHTAGDHFNDEPFACADFCPIAPSLTG